MSSIIGITSRHDNKTKLYNVPEAYVKAIKKNGGNPIIIQPINDPNYDEILAILDGVLLTGGPDLDPQLYGEQPLPKQGVIHPLRDQYEIALAKKLLESDKPFLAICRGEQVINVAAGGTLIQDIGSQIDKPQKHRQEAPAEYGTHSVDLKSGSKIYEIFGKNTLQVNSFHHQAVKDPGKDLKVTGSAKDGVIEVIEIDSPVFKLGVQWHPEYMTGGEMNKLWKAFIDSCVKL